MFADFDILAGVRMKKLSTNKIHPRLPAPFFDSGNNTLQMLSAIFMAFTSVHSTKHKVAATNKIMKSTNIE